MLDVHIIPVTWESHEAALRGIRQSVFVEEQNIPIDLEFDAEDATAWHVLALNSAGQAQGCARMLTNGLIGRVAVLADARGNGLGSQLLTALVDRAGEERLTRVFLHAQAEAEAFYKKLDFIPTGVRFMEAGIEHLTMERALPIPFDTVGIGATRIVRSGDPRPDIDNATSVQKRSRLREFGDEGTAREQLHTVLSGARRSIVLYSPTLDHELFDQSPVVEEMSRLARSAPGAQIDVLIRDSQLIVGRGHALVELARRLDEKLQIRRLGDSARGDDQSWLVADNSALWVQSEPDEYRGWSDTWNPVQAERFSQRFTHLWDRSVSDPELRVLRL